MPDTGMLGHVLSVSSNEITRAPDDVDFSDSLGKDLARTNQHCILALIGADLIRWDIARGI